MSFGIWDSLISSEQEVGLARQASVDKMAAAVYDVRERLGPVLFASRDLEEFRNKVAMMKRDQSLHKIIGVHLDPVSGIMRRIAGRGGVLEKEFKALLATGAIGDEGTTVTDQQKKGIENSDYGQAMKGVDTNTGDGSDASGNVDNSAHTNGKQSRALQAVFQKGAPFAGYKDFDACVAANQDKDDPQAYCGKIKHQVEDSHEAALISRIGDTQNPAAGASIPGMMQPSSPAAAGPQGGSNLGMESGSAPLVTLPLGGGTDSSSPPPPVNTSVASYRAAEFSGDQKLKSTFKPSDDDLVPEGNFDSYLKGVDQNSSKVKRNFSSSTEFRAYVDWCRSAKAHPLNLATLDHYAQNLPDAQYLRLARAIQAWEHEHLPSTGKGQSKTKLKDVTAAQEDPEWENLVHERERRDERAQHPSRVNQARRDPLHAYIAWCKANGFKRISARNVQIYAGNDVQLCYHLAQRVRNAIHVARMRQGKDDDDDSDPDDGFGGKKAPPFGSKDARRVGRENYEHEMIDRGLDGEFTYPPAPKSEQHSDPWSDHGEPNREGRRRHAAPDYLQKADDALTQLLNQKAEEFQETIQPLQQALVTVQQAEQLQQQANPLNVLPPPGTVNVMPGQQAPGDIGQPDPSGGADPQAAAAAALAGGGAPPGAPPGAAGLGAPPGAGTPDDQGGPPPAAAPGGALPPELDPQAQKAARRRGGQGKGRGAARPRQGASVFDLWNKWQSNRGQSGQLGIGGDPDYEAFANEMGIGQQAIHKLRHHHQQGVTAQPMTARRRRAKETPNIAEEAVKNQWRQMDSSMSAAGYKFDKGSQHWTKPGQHPVKNPWPHSAGRHDYDPANPEQEFAPARGHGWEHDSGPSGPPYVRPQTQGEHERGGYHEGSRREAWMGWGPAVFSKAREVTGWNWDNHLNGYIANRPQHFACECGSQFPAPSGFQRCGCGRQWNSYVIGSGGNSHEASADKFIVREVPVRPDVIVANRRLSAPDEANPPSDAERAYFADPADVPEPYEPLGDEYFAEDHRQRNQDIAEHPQDYPHSWDEMEMAPQHETGPPGPSHAHHDPSTGRQADPGSRWAAVELVDPRTGAIHRLVDPGELDEGEDDGMPTFKKPPADWANRGDGARWQKSPIGG